MNLPNKLTVLRILLVLVFIVVMMVWRTEAWATIVGCVIFTVASLTDLFDGKIARKRGLITDFGKFLDPLADKFMVIAALLCIIYRTDAPVFRTVLFIVTMLVIFRELAVTSIRLVASSSSAHVVIAANKLGKFKTGTQVTCIITMLVEPFIPFLNQYLILSYATLACAAVMTVWSGINYMVSYWKFLDPEK